MTGALLDDRAGADERRRLGGRSLKVLLVNYRYFVSGGPERYLFNVTDLLEREGQSVVPFSVTYERNEPTRFAKYFVSPIGAGDQVYFKDHTRDARTVAKELSRAFYSREVYDNLSALIVDEKPDIALVLHYLRKLSPSVTKCLQDHEIPYIVRLSDFGMICPNAHLYRSGGICELCTGGALRHSVKHRCVQGSLAASAVNYAATRVHRVAGFYDAIETFAVPSQFTLEKMAAAGYDRGRLVHLPTFVNTESTVDSARERSPEIVYVGRLEEIKGVHVLLDAIRLLDQDTGIPAHSVRVIGSGNETYVESLRSYVVDHGLTNVSFEGQRTGADVHAALQSALCSVTPSLWYDNMPNSALESMAEGTPVVAPRHGCFPELIDDGKTGLLYEPASAASLAAALKALLLDPARAAQFGAGARAFVLEHHSPQRHYDILMNTFESALTRRTAA